MTDQKYKHRLFGRTRGRSKKKIDINEYYKKLNDYNIKNINTQKKIILDIGSGYGETTMYLANKFQNYEIISCDKYIDGNLKLYNEIVKSDIKNIKMHHGNVYSILENEKKNLIFDSIWIFFPDPWPKKKHFKRRLISDEFLKQIYNSIIPGGQIYIATDSESYIRSILCSIYKNRKMYRWHNQYSSHLILKDYFDIETKFYEKAIISGRIPLLFILEKI